MWILVKYGPRHPSRFQQPESQSLAIPSAIQETIKMVESSYHGIDPRLTHDNEESITRELRQIFLPSERERFLVRLVILLGTIFDFEYIWYNIFASQIDALQELNGGPLKREDLFKHYIRAATSFAAFYSDYSFEQWIGYMRTQVLLREDGDQINITVKGRSFLKHLIDHGRSSSGRMF
jgi:hypothetical protein